MGNSVPVTIRAVKEAIRLLQAATEMSVKASTASTNRSPRTKPCHWKENKEQPSG